MQHRTPSVSVEDIERALTPLEEVGQRFARALAPENVAILTRRAVYRMIPNQVWLRGIPTADDTPHTWPEEVRF